MGHHGSWMDRNPASRVRGRRGGLLPRFVVVVLVLGLIWGAGMAAAQDRRLLLAGLVTKLPGFVEWPAGSEEGPGFTLCIERGAPLTGAFASLARYSRVDGRPLLLRRVGAADSLAGCRLLFLSSETGIGGLLRRVRGRPVLTVSTLDGAARRGVMVEIGLPAGGRPHFRVNRAAVKASPIELSFRLLELAEIVK